MSKKCRMYLSFFLCVLMILTASFTPGMQAIASPQTSAAVAENGLNAEYYDKADLTKLKVRRTDANINFDWGKKSPVPSVSADDFSVRWTGYIVPRYTETYRFYTLTDDGVRLWINGQLIIDHWKEQSATEREGKIALEAGKAYSIKMEYYEHKQQAVAKLYWSSNKQVKQIVPKECLFTTAPDTTPPSKPANLSATFVSGTSVLLTWSASTDNTSTQGYEVYRDNKKIADTVETKYTDQGLQAGKSYTYYVKAYDKAKNLSEASNPVSIVIPTPGQNTSTRSIDLSPYFNEDAYSYDTNRNDGNFDGSGSTYSADLLKPQLTHDDTQYILGPMQNGAKNSIRCNGQTIDLPDNPYLSLRLAAAATNGDKSGVFRINYTDGTYTDVPVTLADWCTKNTAGQKIIFSAGHRHNGEKDQATVNYIFAYYLTPVSGKTVTSLTLPNAKDIHVLAVSLLSAAASPSGKGNGLTGEYFSSMNLSNLKVTRIDPQINFDWGTGQPTDKIGADNFSVRWSGYIEPKYSENYTFYTLSDDGVRLWVDDRLIINQWSDHSATEHSGVIRLTGNKKYKIKLEYYENKTYATIQLMWSSPSQPKELIPKEQLYTSALSKPTALTAVLEGSTSVALAWGSPSGSSVEGYEVYRNGIKITTVKGTKYTDRNLSPGQTYVYTVKAYDSKKNYSEPSDPASITIPGPVQSPSPISLDLSAYWNEDAYSYDTDRTDGNFDHSASSYSADLANARLTYDNVLYVFGPMKNDTSNSIRCTGQTIDIPDQRYASIHLAAAATNGDKSGTFRIHYTDGTYTDVVLTFKDWCASSITGQKVIYAMGHRHAGGTDNYINTYIFGYSLNPTSGKTVASITLPNSSHMHILAMTLLPSAVTGPITGSGTGLKGEYFKNSNLTALAFTRTDPTINFDWGI